jgi:hypothetical protein
MAHRILQEHRTVFGPETTRRVADESMAAHGDHASCESSQGCPERGSSAA